MPAARLDTLGGLEFALDCVALEQRAEDRLVLSDQPAGRISVLTPFARVAARQVHDISRSGIRLELERPIGPDTPVSVEYVADDINLTVVGRLVWSQAATSNGAVGGYEVGIELYSPGLLLNFLPTVSH